MKVMKVMKLLAKFSSGKQYLSDKLAYGPQKHCAATLDACPLWCWIRAGPSQISSRPLRPNQNDFPSHNSEEHTGSRSGRWWPHIRWILDGLANTITGALATTEMRNLHHMMVCL
eukprot:g70744.t1